MREDTDQGQEDRELSPEKGRTVGPLGMIVVIPYCGSLPGTAGNTGIVHREQNLLRLEHPHQEGYPLPGQGQLREDPGFDHFVVGVPETLDFDSKHRLAQVSRAGDDTADDWFEDAGTELLGKRLPEKGDP